MPEYRRSFLPGGTFFFTIVTYHRKSILTSQKAREILHSAMEDVNRRYPFSMDAICLLPDHIHCIWTLPEGDTNYSIRWGEIKKQFTKSYHQLFGNEGNNTASRLARGEATIWQRRFWEHTIRDEDDLNQHLDYIHYNPVKHGLVETMDDWQWSSFHRYVKMGYYGEAWNVDKVSRLDSSTFGE